MSFETSCLDEPDLIFGGNGEEKDPRKGMERYGPYYYVQEESPSLKNIRVGIIGTQETISLCLEVLELLKKDVESRESNKWLYRGFPGFKLENKIGCVLQTATNYHEKLSVDNEIEKVINISDMNQRIAAGVNLYINKIKELKKIDDPPNVIICTLPKQIETYCGISEFTRGAKSVKPTPLQKIQNELKEKHQTFLGQWGATISVQINTVPKSFDFRNALKGKAMEFGIPTQILRESSARSFLNFYSNQERKGQDPASFLWNFGTALYYKAQGKPWRLAKLRQDTCYVGISFYKTKLSPNNEMETSMAQVFTEDGQGLVLNGSEVIIDPKTKEAHLSENQAYELLSNAIKMYIEKAKKNPVRVVVHKESLFDGGETKGFNKAIYEIGNIEKDFVSLLRRHNIKFMREGIYPVLRGTSIKFDNNTCILYTSGYTPRIRTYPGHRIPIPLKIVKQGDSDLNTICQEILGLTKLNWNTTSFSTFLPITLEFSKEVGKILSEYSGTTLQNHYRFYM